MSEKRKNGRFVMSGTECRTLKLEPAPGPTIDQVQFFLYVLEGNVLPTYAGGC